MIFSGGGRICLPHQRRPGGKRWIWVARRIISWRVATGGWRNGAADASGKLVALRGGAIHCLSNEYIEATDWRR
jgi:hypothetical protein